MASIRRPATWTTVLVALTAVLVAAAAGAGLLFRGDLATRPFTTVRGDVVEVVTDGIYRSNGLAFVAEGIGWDLVTLVAVVPALLLAVPGLSRGSTRAILLTAGLLAYTLYQYAEYAMALAYGPAFLLHVTIAGLSASLLAILVAGLDLGALATTGDRGRFPRRAMALFSGFLAILLLGMWGPLVLRTAALDRVPELAGGTTLVVQAFDLGFLVPLAILTAAAVWRRLPIGYVLATVLAVKGVAMGAAIAAMLIVEGLVAGTWAIAPILAFSAIASVALVLAARTLLALGGGAGSDGLRLIRPAHAT